MKNITSKKKLENQLAAVLAKETKIREQIEKVDAANQPKSIMDIIQSFEDACKYRKKDPNKVRPYPKPKTDDEKWHNAAAELRMIISVWAEGWVTDWKNKNQKKWFPIFYWKDSSSGRSSGFVYSNSNYFYVHSYSNLGSRFAFETEEKAICAGKRFLKIYEIYLNR